ncbi:hypothetical protein [Rivularia sp. UHCC 0363]|uniref:hypothetical protein n=1 Tax=Rivularia sp. UHCC 0363 TaxID=3110244 RepID=UPI002B1EA764|nr:hypothetical protein [Rivularia sp. UHCC 0363]MEA5596993.1 hypothetical protein [Rivularia sp. UHCC 0363]
MKFTLLYNPDLAGALRELGIPHPGEAAIFLSQLHYWLKKEGCGHITRDGKHWIYNTYKKWISQIKSLTISQLGKMIRALASLGLIEKTTFAEQRHSLKGEKPVGFSSWNNTTWVTLCVEKIKELTGCELFEDQENDLPEENGKEPLEPAHQADVHIRTSGDSQSDDRIFHSESSSIYKENLSLTKDEENTFERKKENLANASSEYYPDQNTDKKQLSAIPKIPKVDKSPRSSQIREKRINDQDKSLRNSQLRDKRTIEQNVVQEIWEIAIAQPFPAFLNWRATIHYKPQGGKWETDAYGNAYSEFYRNREKTTAVLFPQFMNEVRAITEKVNQAQSCDASSANVLPSWFIESLPDPTPENVRQLMENLDAVIKRGTRIALPSKSNTPSDITVDYHEAHSQVAIKPLPQLEAPVLKGLEAPFSLSGVEEAPSSDLQKTLARKQAQWNAPILRDHIRRWAESTPGVVVTLSGPQLETAIETNRNNTAINEIETNRSNTAIDKVETFRNKIETSNPLAQKQVDKVETNSHGAEITADVEINNSSTEVGTDYSHKNNSPSSKSERSVSSNNHGVEQKADVENNNQLTHKHTDVSISNRLASKVALVKTNNLKINSQDAVIDDPWETQETRVSNTNSIPEGSSSSTELRRPLIKLMLASWDNIYELGKLVLNAREEDLSKAVSSLSSHHRAHIKKAATRAWYPGLNRDGDYKGEQVEIWEVGQSPIVKVRTKRGAFLKVRRSDLKPWLGI